MKDVVQMMVDLAHNSIGEYSADNVNDALRKKLFEIAGTENINYKTMRRFKPEVFQVLEEALDVLVVEGLENQFDDFVDIHNLDWGDTNIFTVDDPSLFKVAIIADGTNNIRRQRLDNGSFTVDTHIKAIKIYEEFYRFLAGRIDWIKMVNKVSQSYNQDIANEIYNAIYNSFDILSTPYSVSGTYDEDKLLDIIRNVEAATGMESTIMGTKNSLAQVTTAIVSDEYKKRYNDMGFYGSFHGTSMDVIKQAHKPGTDEFAINDNFLIITPKNPDKMVKLVIEGDSIITETPGGQNADMSMEYTFIKKAGTAIVPASKFGIYRLA